MLIVMLMLILLCPTVYAEDEIIGRIYPTDIVTTVNGAEVQSYNLGGRTALVLEDLSEYGIFTSYNNAERKLYCYTTGLRPDVNASYIPDVGEGNVYKTDIQVIFNGRPINGFNIGGKTAVYVSELANTEDYSAYLAKYTWSEEARRVEVSFPTENIDAVCGGNLPCYEYYAVDDVIYAHHDPMNKYLSDFVQSESGIYYYSDTPELYTLKTLYIGYGDELFKIGRYYTTDYNGYYENRYIVDDISALFSELRAKIPPPATYDNAVGMILGSYQVSTRLDNDSYTVFLLNDTMLVAVSRNGGYRLIENFTGYEKGAVSVTLHDNNELFVIASGQESSIILSYYLDEIKFK